MAKLTGSKIGIISHLILFSIFFGESSGLAYNIQTDGTVRTPRITSVLGEPRTNSCPTPGTACRFHEGIDAAGAGFTAGSEMHSIEPGTVDYVGPTRVDVRSASGRIFHYTHVVQVAGDPYVTEGDAVSENSVIGQVEDLGSQTHLHLEEILHTAGADYAINPQRSGGLAFVDDDLPQFINTTIGGATGKVIPIKEYDAGEDGTNPAIEVLPMLPDGSYLASGKIDLLVTARDGGSRKGVYLVGITVSPKENPGELTYNRFNNIRFDSVLDDNPYAGIKTIYLRRNSDSDTYIGTNSKHNFSPEIQASEDYSLNVNDSRIFPDGQYEACAYILDYPDAPISHYQNSCVDYFRTLLTSLVGHGFNLIPQSIVANTLKFTPGDLAIALDRTWRAASYARGVALCQPRQRLAKGDAASMGCSIPLSQEGVMRAGGYSSGYEFHGVDYANMANGVKTITDEKKSGKRIKTHRSHVTGLVECLNKYFTFRQTAEKREPGIGRGIGMRVIKIFIIACEEIPAVFGVPVINLQFSRFGNIAGTIINKNCYFLRIAAAAGKNYISGIIRDGNSRRFIIYEPIISRAGFDVEYA